MCALNENNGNEYLIARSDMMKNLQKPDLIQMMRYH